jgi:hypothetical protein
LSGSPTSGRCSNSSDSSQSRDAAAVAGLDQVFDVQHRLAEELVAALLLEREETALDRANGRGRYVAVVGLKLLRVVADVLQQRAQVFGVEQQQAVVVGNLVRKREDAFLSIVQLEESLEQQRSHVRHRRADRMTALGKHIPEDDGTCRERRHVELE